VQNWAWCFSIGEAAEMALGQLRKTINYISYNGLGLERSGKEKAAAGISERQ
jgi:hypothetical protein